ncbi:M-phase inducer phosphatase 1-B [Varanus komodoensis]|nr:M-phase inducer phosphatase 1-B [Varanus komodoensis]
MSENFLAEADTPRLHLQFRSNCRMVVNLLQDAEVSLPVTPEPLLTPVLCLTQDFRNLSTLAVDTPRRRLDLSNLSNGEEETAFNFSPAPETVETEQKGFTELQDQLGSRKLCVQSLQPQVRCSTPGTPSSMHQVINEIRSPSMNKENDAGDPEDYEMKDLGSPIAAVASPRIPEALDGFPEPCPCEQEETEKPFAGHVSSMVTFLSGPLLTQDINVSEVSLNKSHLFRCPSLPEKLNRPMLKKAVKGQENGTPTKEKWRHTPIQEEPDGIVLLKKTASLSDIEIVRALDQDHGFRQLIGDLSSHRNVFLNRESTNKVSIATCSPNLCMVTQKYAPLRSVGHIPKETVLGLECIELGQQWNVVVSLQVYSLPTVAGRQQELRYITSETMASLLHDQFQNLIEKFCIIDCRYPYEYHGGHIKGALNIHRQEDLFEFFLRKPLLLSAPQKRLILVFHCEYSSERAPKMCRYLRKEDRAMNEYPALHYPELYVLRGGYKHFFLTYKELCEPQSYCPMHHQDFKAEMLKFRVKSKAWAGGRRRRDQIAHPMKL